jgi:hypothetical protein
MTDGESTQDRPNGPVAAVLLAGGIGAAALGVVTVLAELSHAFRDNLDWWPPAGPLAGKSAVCVVAFLASWAILYYALRSRNVNFVPVAIIALALLAMGLLCTFPPFYSLFAGG